MSANNTKELEARVSELEVKLANANKVIQDVNDALNDNMSGIWPGSPIHHQIDLYLNPVVIDENEGDGDDRVNRIRA